MKVLVTGGAGFIGCHLSAYLVGLGCDVTIVDNLYRGEMDDIFSSLIKHPRVKFINLDLMNKKKFRKLGKYYNHVYHLAAVNGTKNFYDRPYEVSKINLLSLINMLDWTEEVCPKARFIWTSSSEVYASGKVKIPTPEDVNLTISDIHNPRFSYASSKIAGESIVLNSPLDTMIVRPHNIYGPRMGHDHVIPAWIKYMCEGEDPFRVYGWNETRSFCHIHDFVRGIVLIAGKGKSKEVYNLGNPEEIKILDLAKIMFKIAGYTANIKREKGIPGSTKRRCPDISKVRALGYEPQICLKEGLEQMMECCQCI